MKKNTMQLTLFITNACNLDCIYCYQHLKNTKTMSFECATSWINKCLSNNNEFVNIYLFGGEPMLEFHLLKRICEWTWQQTWNSEYRFVIQTNGTLLDTEMKDWFAKNKDKIELCLSLDGNREAHNKNRNNSFDKIDIGFFKNTWPNPPVKMTISKSNLSNLKESIVWLHELRFRFSGCNLALGEGAFDESFFYSLSTQLKQLADYYIANPIIKIAPIINVPIHRLASNDTQKHISCHIETEQLVVVNTDGSTSPCSFFSNISLNKNQREELQKELDGLSIEKLYCYENCKFFNVCDICYAENYTETGDIYKPSESRCKLMMLRIIATMYTKANRIALKKKEEITQEDLYTVHSILQYYRQLQSKYNIDSFNLSESIIKQLINLE